MNLFLGQSNFHAAGIALSTKKPTYVLDPYFNELRDVTKFAETLEKKATLTIFKAADAKTFGVIVGLKEGQFAQLTALKFKKELEKEGKIVQLIGVPLFAYDNVKTKHFNPPKEVGQLKDRLSDIKSKHPRSNL